MVGEDSSAAWDRTLEVNISGYLAGLCQVEQVGDQCCINKLYIRIIDHLKELYIKLIEHINKL